MRRRWRRGDFDGMDWAARNRKSWKSGVYKRHSSKLRIAWESGAYDRRVLPVARLSKKAKQRWKAGHYRDMGKKLQQRWIDGDYDGVGFTNAVVKRLWRTGAYNHVDRKALARRSKYKTSETMKQRWKEGYWSHVDWSEMARERWRKGQMHTVISCWRGKPTRYKGTLFRSRIEANWAMELDEFGVRWRYEPKRLLLPNGETYLPDFWLPQLRVWLEVKGEAPHPFATTRKAQLAQRAGIPLIIVMGPGALVGAH